MHAGDQYLMSWTEWAYSGQNDITTSDTSGQEGLVYDPNVPPTGANVNTGSLATLAAPYPQVTSGTPNAWSFADGTFQYSYSTEKADGSSSFAPGSLTTITAPAVEYPHGYQVSVTGGHVVSSPNAAQLVVASDVGATLVFVVVKFRFRQHPRQSPGPHSGVRLIDALGLTSGIVGLRLDRLVKAGTVTREPDPDGRRGTMISCTEGGQRLFDVLAPDHLLPPKTNLAGTHIRRLVRNRHSCAQFVS